MISIGKIVNTHGIRGEIKVQNYMDSPDSFISVKEINVDGRTYIIEKASVHNNFLIVKLKGIADMTEAEKIKGKEIFCEYEDLPELDEGRYYISDIIGCTVTDGENDYGKVRDIFQYGSADVVVCIKKGKKIMFPWIKELNASINIDAKIFRVDKQKFSEVVLDED